MYKLTSKKHIKLKTYLKKRDQCSLEKHSAKKEETNFYFKSRAWKYKCVFSSKWPSEKPQKCMYTNQRAKGIPIDNLKVKDQPPEVIPKGHHNQSDDDLLDVGCFFY